MRRLSHQSVRLLDVGLPDEEAIEQSQLAAPQPLADIVNYGQIETTTTTPSADDLVYSDDYDSADDSFDNLVSNATTATSTAYDEDAASSWQSALIAEWRHAMRQCTERCRVHVLRTFERRLLAVRQRMVAELRRQCDAIDADVSRLLAMAQKTMSSSSQVEIRRPKPKKRPHSDEPKTVGGEKALVLNNHNIMQLQLSDHVADYIQRIISNHTSDRAPHITNKSNAIRQS